MDVECTLKTVEYDFDKRSEIKFKSIDSDRFFKIIIGDKVFELDAHDVIKAIQNCTNC